MEQRLAPNTKLSEASLCETFNVGRMHVRRALLLLSSQGIIDLHSNRGAYVACPDKSEAQDIVYRDTFRNGVPATTAQITRWNNFIYLAETHICYIIKISMGGNSFHKPVKKLI